MTMHKSKQPLHKSKQPLGLFVISSSLCLTLSRTFSPQFINIDQIQNKRSIGAVMPTRGHLEGVEREDEDNIAAKEVMTMQVNICK
jgi:hypothetical protein